MLNEYQVRTKVLAVKIEVTNQAIYVKEVRVVLNRLAK